MRLDRAQRLPRLQDGDDSARIGWKDVALRPPLDLPTELLRQLVEQTRTLRTRGVRRQARVAAAASYFFRRQQSDEDDEHEDGWQHDTRTQEPLLGWPRPACRWRRRRQAHAARSVECASRSERAASSSAS